MVQAPSGLHLTVMVQGLDIAPWGVSAKVSALGFQADIRTRLRPAAMGNLALLNMLGWKHQPISPLLASGHPEASAQFQELISFLAKHAYGLQVVIHRGEEDESVEDAVEISPTEVKTMLPTLYRMGSVMAFVRSRSREYIMRY